MLLNEEWSFNVLLYGKQQQHNTFTTMCTCEMEIFLHFQKTFWCNICTFKHATFRYKYFAFSSQMFTDLR